MLPRPTPPSRPDPDPPPAQRPVRSTRSGTSAAAAASAAAQQIQSQENAEYAPIDSRPSRATAGRSQDSTQMQGAIARANPLARSALGRSNVPNRSDTQQQSSNPGSLFQTPRPNVPPPTPGRSAAQRLAERTRDDRGMTVPGPRFQDWRVDESESDREGNRSDDDPFPPIPSGRRPLRVDSDDDGEREGPSEGEGEEVAPNRRGATRGRGRSRGRRGARGRTASRARTQPTHAPGADDTLAAAQTEKSRRQPRSGVAMNWAGWDIDERRFAWAGDEVLAANQKTADTMYFFGENVDTGERKCQLCGQLYANASSVSVRRGHLERQHLAEYTAHVDARSLASMLPTAQAEKVKAQRAAANSTRPPFTMHGFYTQLVKVITSNDLAINLIENREFRELLLMLRETLNDSDIPHRSKLRSLIIEYWLKYWEELKRELAAALGRLSFTADMWSSLGMHPYLAITVHWLARRADGAVVLRQALLAFRRVRGAHSGARLARIVMNIFLSAGIVKQVGHFTMDNATINPSLLEHLERLLQEHNNFDFNSKDNFIRCFSHIINLCSQAVLKSMLKDDTADRHSDTETEEATASDDSDSAALPVRRTTRKAGPLQRARKTVAFIRKSGQRRDELASIIEDGNVKQAWSVIQGDNTRITIVLKPVTLLPGVKTRWDSEFYLLRRLRYLREPVERFFILNRDARDFHHKLTPVHWDRLELMELILRQAHNVQSIMAAENTPMLAATIPAFELFVNSWTAMRADPELEDQNITQFIDPGLAIAEKYYNKLDDTDAYILAMFLNPSVRFEWIQKHWSQTEVKEAKKKVIARLEKYSATDDADDSQPQLQLPSGAAAAAPQPRSRAVPAATRITTIANKYRSTANSLNFSADGQGSSSGTRSAEAEMKHYISSAIPSRAATDMIAWWTTIGHQQWPRIYKMFLDYAPIQATSVPSERIFSSSAQTDTKRRNRIGPVLMEALQMLKFSFKKAQLDFFADIRAAPEFDPEEDEDWLRMLGTETDPEKQKTIAREIWDEVDLLDGAYFDMPEDGSEI